MRSLAKDSHQGIQTLSTPAPLSNRVAGKEVLIAHWHAQWAQTPRPLGGHRLPLTAWSLFTVKVSRNPGCSDHRIECKAGTWLFFPPCRGKRVDGTPPRFGEQGSGNRPRPLLTTLGLKGGWISLFSSFSQSILRKKACSRTSLSPSGPQPSRLPGCLVIS